MGWGWDAIKKAADYVPGVSTAKNLYEGNWLDAATSFVPGVSQASELYEDVNGAPIGDALGMPRGYGGGRDLGQALGDGWQGVKDAVNGPYEQKAKGYDAIRGEVDRLKGERKGQKDFAYNLADSKYEPTRKAINALYGDPSTWKL